MVFFCAILIKSEETFEMNSGSENEPTSSKETKTKTATKSTQTRDIYFESPKSFSSTSAYPETQSNEANKSLIFHLNSYLNLHDPSITIAGIVIDIDSPE